MAQYAGRAVGWDGVPSSCEQAAGLGMTMTAPGTLNTGHWPLATDGHRPSTQGHIVSDLQVQPGQLRRTT